MEHGFEEGVSSLYDAVIEPLKVVQTAAAVEILHSLLGIVPSNVMTTSAQVLSRLFVLYGIVETSPPCRYVRYCFCLLLVAYDMSCLSVCRRTLSLY